MLWLEMSSENIFYGTEVHTTVTGVLSFNIASSLLLKEFNITQEIRRPLMDESDFKALFYSFLHL